MITINPERLLGDLRAMAAFGKVGTGVDRLAFSAVDMESRAWLRQRMAEAGLAAEIDGIGSVFGRTPAAGPKILIGSHTDTVPKGGWLDGTMGVIYGLEIARAIAESPHRGQIGVDVISFQDEEGTYFGFLGSRAFAGELTEADVAGARSIEGRPLAETLKGHGLDRRPRAALEKGRYAGYMEAHIEQGPRLEAERRRIGVVTGIVGYRRHRVRFLGQADHAGTTPLPMRKDAGKALIAFGHCLDADFRGLAGECTVWTFGNATFAPGAFNVVPGTAELFVEYRDTAPERLDRFERCLGERVADANRIGPVKVSAERVLNVVPAAMDQALAGKLAAAAEYHGERPIAMPSGAGHDAMIMARHLPSAMMFIPSKGGRSHDIAEDTDEADIVLGCRVFATAVELVLTGGA